jgi:hypothetical protein
MNLGTDVSIVANILVVKQDGKSILFLHIARAMSLIGENINTLLLLIVMLNPSVNLKRENSEKSKQKLQ